MYQPQGRSGFFQGQKSSVKQSELNQRRVQDARMFELQDKALADKKAAQTAIEAFNESTKYTGEKFRRPTIGNQKTHFHDSEPGRLFIQDSHRGYFHD